MTGVNDNALQILKDGLENTVSIHRATLSPISRHQYDDDSADKKEHSGAEEPSSNTKTDEQRGGDNNTYAVERIVRHVGSGSHVRYVVQWYGYSKADDTTEPLHHIPQHFIEAYWRRFNERKEKKALMGVF